MRVYISLKKSGCKPIYGFNDQQDTLCAKEFVSDRNYTSVYLRKHE